MKISTFFACFVPELRKLSAGQLMKIWSACAPCSQNWVYLHLLLVLACCSLIFSFTNDIAPLLVQKCLTCHGPEKNKGGYRLDSFESLLKPGSSKEPSVTPGKPASSKLFQLITAADEDDRMPQKNEPLSASAIAL